MKFKIGDKVRIKKDLKPGFDSGTLLVNNAMCLHKGKITTVIKVDYDGDFKVDIDNGEHYWNEKMIEPAKIPGREYSFLEVMEIIEKRDIFYSVQNPYRVKEIKGTNTGIELRGNLGNSLNPNVLGVNFKEQTFKLKEVKERVTIYHVEHKEGGKHYDFISNDELSMGDFVVCNTRYGDCYGRVKGKQIVSLTTTELDQYKYCKWVQ